MISNFVWQVRSLLVCAVIVFAFQSVVLGQLTSQEKAAKIAEVMTTANKYRLFNGSALVAENGKVIYKQGLGLANMEWKIPNTPETKFQTRFDYQTIHCHPSIMQLVQKRARSN